MDKKNYWVIVLMVALAIGLLAAVTLLRPSGGQNGEIVVTVDGAEYARVPLGQKQTLTVTQEDGSVNVIEISERGAVMASSTCRNQLCVQMGEVTLDNWETRPNQQFIICLPNRVSVELVLKE